MRQKLRCGMTHVCLWFSIVGFIGACDLVPLDPVGDLKDDSDQRVETSKAVCGNGYLEEGEECDDGSNDGGEGECQPGCHLLAATPFCGDGIVQSPNEECDHGELNGESECQSDCTLAMTTACGDGIVDAGEECDDGVNDGGHQSPCNPDCTLASSGTCGDGVVDSGEQCDDGNTESFDGCSNSCKGECGFLCESSGMPCQADCGNLIVYSCIVGDAALSICCADGKDETMCDDWQAPALIEQLMPGNYLFEVDRTVKNPSAIGIGHALVETDYTSVAGGDSYVVTLGMDLKTITIADDTLADGTLTGALQSQELDRIIYSIDNGFFAGGIFTIWVEKVDIQGELTAFGSGVAFVSSGRGSMTYVEID